MSFNLHIPIDDIKEEDLEADLRQVEEFGKPGHRATGFDDGQLDLSQVQPRFNAYPAPVAQNHQRHWNTDEIDQDLGSDKEIQPGPNRGPAGSGSRSGVDDTVRYGVGTDREISDADVAFARHDIQTGRDKLYQSEMQEEFRPDPKTLGDNVFSEKENSDEDDQETTPATNNEKKDNKHISVDESNTDADIVEKSKFVKAKKKNNRQKQQDEISSTESPNKVLMKLMADLKSLRDEKKDKALLKTVVTSKNTVIDDSTKEDVGSEKDTHPYARKQHDKNKNLPGKDHKGSKTNAKEKLASPDSKSMMKELLETTTTASRKKARKKGKHHKKPIFGKETQLDNEAVEMMVGMDRNTNRNQTTQFTLVDKGKDRVDLALTETDRAWIHKVHGQRDIVIAGAIVMCVGMIVIIVSLIALVRRRFLKSAKRKRDKNNNRRYRTLGSASETQMLRKSQKSLFPSAVSSDNDDDDDDDTGEESSSSSEEIIYHQRKVNKSF